MPKSSKHPRLRSHVRKGRGEQSTFVANPGWDEVMDRYKIDCQDGIPHTIVHRTTVWKGPRLGTGAYLMIKGNEPYYVGQSLDLNLRMIQHTRKDWNALIIFQMPDWLPHEHNRDWLDLMEFCAYAEFDPYDNGCPVRDKVPAPSWLTEAFKSLHDSLLEPA